MNSTTSEPQPAVTSVVQQLKAMIRQGQPFEQTQLWLQLSKEQKLKLLGFLEKRPPVRTAQVAKSSKSSLDRLPCVSSDQPMVDTIKMIMTSFGDCSHFVLHASDGAAVEVEALGMLPCTLRHATAWSIK